MVFSFFKKDPKGGDGKRPAGRSASKPGTRSAPAPAGKTAPAAAPPARSANGPVTAPDKQLARSLAAATAAKIDAIESEMARDFLRPTITPSEFQNSAANSTLAPASQQPVPPDDVRLPVEPETPLTIPGNADAIELGEGGSSAIEETAILFANGLADAAEAGLRAAIETDALGDAAQRGWLMLFELLQQRGDRTGFEGLTVEYVLRFESSPPAWLDYRDDPSPAARGPARPAPAPVIALPAAIDADVVPCLEALKRHSLAHQAITLDASGVRSVDMVGAELLLRVINAFKRASHALTVVGAEHLIQPLRAALEPGRRDPSDAVWMLLLEVYRLLDRQHDFEEAGIQYCVTYEVSPPSWEPAPSNLKASDQPLRAVPASEPVDEGLQWRGTLRAGGEPHFTRLLAAAAVDKQLVVDCTHLRRVEFSTATAMLGMLNRVRHGGGSVEFRNVNYLVAALFALLGVDAVAQVQLRRV